MKVFRSIGHFFATIGHGIAKAASAVKAEAPVIAADAQKAEPVVAAVATSIFGAAADPIVSLAFQMFGNGVAVASEASDTALAQGLSIPLDTKLIADLKALAPQFEAFAAALGINKPTNVPTVAPKAV